MQCEALGAGRRSHRGLDGTEELLRGEEAFLGAKGGFLEGAGGCMVEPFAGEDGLEGAEEEVLRIYNFDQEDGEKLPEAWERFCSLIRAQPDHDLEKHDLLDIFYSGLTIESRAYLDSCAGCVFRKRTPDDAEELLAKIGRNHDDWSTPEPTPTPIVKKRGMIKLNDEDMREAKKSLKEKGIKPEDVKNLPPIEDLCEITPLHP
ncbi:hypothetical protein QYE76_052528 [Lolium multiflorum]|uniref:Uncharacterized protein n=1 Tax=Lolium multiflorum TaxID=4521 RepID=A0AAD8SUU6_LOLMU|nr:hypothetical protein QYE76_052528 [Lolium multiflorum]